MHSSMLHRTHSLASEPMSMFRQHVATPIGSAVSAHERRARVLRPATAQLDEHGEGRSTRQPPPLRVYPASAAAETAAPLADTMAAFQEPAAPNLPTADAVDIQAVREPVAAEMEQMAINLRNAVGRRHPMLMSAADQIFGAGGKRLRPMIVFLVGKATCVAANMHSLTDRHLRLAEITEMIHTASLLHDDVLDDCDTRRGTWLPGWCLSMALHVFVLFILPKFLWKQQACIFVTVCIFTTHRLRNGQQHLRIPDCHPHW